MTSMSISKDFSDVLASVNAITLLKKLYYFNIYVKIMAKTDFWRKNFGYILESICDFGGLFCRRYQYGDDNRNA